MPGLHLFRSNRIELLARFLAAVLLDGLPPSPFARLQVVVGSRGMERWLRHELAQHDAISICANFDFPFPATRLDDIVASLLGDARPDRPRDPWAPDTLAWAILEVLPAVVRQPGFDLVREYLRDPAAWDGPIDARQYGLARQLAEVFDRYVAYRPDVARGWSANTRVQLPPGAQSLAWQRDLWRAVQAQLDGRSHRSARIAQAEEKLRQAKPPAIKADPLVIFGVSSLPPSWMSFLGALSRHVDVNLFLLCPSPVYWADLHDAVERNGAKLAPLDRNELSEELGNLPHDAAHPLLVSMGRVARDFQIVLESQPDHYVNERLDSFPDPVKPEAPRALAWLQSDLLQARHPGRAAADTGRTLLPPDDSLQFHCCHGPTRQVEVLRNLLLGLLQDDDSLEPRHILVMTPDIETYAPLVTAVFSQGPDRRRETDHKPIPGPEGWGPAGAPRIPFEVDDLSIRRLNPVADALVRVLELVDGRLEASALVDLLTLEPVRERFGLSPEDVTTVQQWIELSGIRWARDAEHRASEGQPPDPQNTWRFGLRRLLLGVVMADDGRLLAGHDCPGRSTEVRPFDDMEGQETVLLGRLTDFCNTLFEAVDTLREPRPAAAWVRAFEDVIARMTVTPPASSWLGLRVRETLAELAGSAGDAKSQRPIALDAMRGALAGRFEDASRVTREHSGAVTFCAMRPMRSVPYEVICLLGMDEDAFPRKGAGFAFDLTSVRPVVGDMDPRDEDRYLMLEAILAARRNFIVLYSGRDPRTNAERPPCVPVGELRDLVDQSFPPPPNALSAAAWMTTEHPLQAFSVHSFVQPVPGEPPAASRRWGFDRRMRAAAEARRNRLLSVPPIFTQPAEAGAAAPVPTVISLDDLVDFFKNPPKHLLKRRLRLDLEDRAGAIPDREPIELDYLQRWQLRRAVLDDRLAARPPTEAFRRFRAEGSLPLGYAGKVTVDTHADLVEAMLQKVNLAGTDVPPPATVAIDLKLDGIRLTGSLANIRGSLLIDLQFGEESSAHILPTWLSLLAWCAAEPGAGKAVLVLGKTKKGVAAPQVLGLRPPADPRAALTRLVAIYQRGLREPIPLFPQSSWTFADKLKGVASDPAFFDDGLPDDPQVLAVVESALESALGKWEAAFGDGDSDDPYIARLFEGTEPLVDDDQSPVPLCLDFARLALALWGPYREGRETSTTALAWLPGGAR